MVGADVVASDLYAVAVGPWQLLQQAVARRLRDSMRPTPSGISRRRSRLIRRGRRGRTTKGQGRHAERLCANRERARQGGQVARAIRDLDGVQLAEDLAGPYDVIARVQASGLDELGRLIVFRIQVLDGVTRTLTCMVLHR
jgi:DNA-binding Lrp family transcriptional regulator